MQNVALGTLALAHGRNTKRTRYESLGVTLPEVDRDLGRTQQGVEPCFDATTPAKQVRHRKNHRKDASQLHSGFMVTQKGSRPSDGMFDVAGVLKAHERDNLAASAQASRKALERTWRECHTKASALRLLVCRQRSFR